MFFSDRALGVKSDDFECGTKGVEQDSKEEKSTSLRESGGSGFWNQ
jgi:hypothetical protein